jgi:hypothetical protein
MTQLANRTIVWLALGDEWVPLPKKRWDYAVDENDTIIVLWLHAEKNKRADS